MFTSPQSWKKILTAMRQKVIESASLELYNKTAILLGKL